MQPTNPTPIHALKQQITASRCKLQDLWNARGVSDATVLAASIELDHLINQYQRLKNRVETELPDREAVSE